MPCGVLRKGPPAGPHPQSGAVPIRRFPEDAPSFIAPQPLGFSRPKPIGTGVSRRPRTKPRVRTTVAAANPSSSTREEAKRSSSSSENQRKAASSSPSFGGASTPAGGLDGALERETATDRYVDLRSLKKVGWRDVRVAAAAAPGCRFGPFSSAAAVAALGNEVLFGSDTVPLSPPQQSAVRALLSRRSVLYSSTLPGREALVIDLSSRARQWGQTIVYCAPTLRAAEAMYMFMCSFASGEKHVVLDVGHELDGNTNTPPSRSCPSLVITVPQVLRRAIVDVRSRWWMSESDLYLLDDMLMPGVPEWEEIIIGMPSRALLCIFATDLNPYELDEFPLWLETVQNCIVPVRCRGSVRFSDRVDRPMDAPLARAFIYNPARHAHPIQVSLPLVAEELRKELASGPTGRMDRDLSSRPFKTGRKERQRDLHPSMRNVDDIVAAEGAGQFANALLRGVKILSAENVTELIFDAESEAMFADVASLVLADARSGAEKTTRRKKRVRRKSKTTRKTAAMLHAASTKRRRREEAELLPAFVLMHGPGEAENTANAILSCLRDASVELLYNEDAEELLSTILDTFMEEHDGMMSEQDVHFVSSMRKGVGVVHVGMLPILRTLAEELFRDGLLAVLCVDSYVGPRELVAMPRGRSLLVQSSVLAEESDMSKGIVKGSLLGSMAGRPGLDDVGNVVAVWYDDRVDDVQASGDLAAALFSSEIGFGEPHIPGDDSKAGASSIGVRLESNSKSGLSAMGFSTAGKIGSRRRSGEFLMNYRGLLGTVRRHGYDDYANVANYVLESYRSWMIGAGLRATREKVEIEKRAVDEHLTDVKWDELATHDRLEASLNEQSRLLRAMAARKDTILVERLLDELRSSQPGTLVGLLPSRELLLSASKSVRGDEGSDAAVTGDGVTPEVTHDVSGEADGTKSPKIVPAILVSVQDQSVESRQAAPVAGPALVVCIMVDGMWTLAPADSVVAIADKKDPVQNVDLIPIPHLATFDVDPVTKWAKCKPISESENLRVNAVAEELIGDLTSGAQLADGLAPRLLPEYENQVERVSAAKKAYEASSWAGRDAEIADLRRLRSRAVGLSEEAESMRNAESKLDSSVQQLRGNLDSRIRGMLAVLEDCNAVSVPGDGLMEMTPIGSVASLLPGPFPLFAAACLLLVSGLNEMTSAQLAGFVAVLVSSCPTFDVRRRSHRDTKGDKDLFESLRSNKRSDREAEDSKFQSLFPAHVFEEMEQIRSALDVVQRRHFEPGGTSGPTPLVVPEKLDGRTAIAVHSFVSGKSTWGDIVKDSWLDIGQLVGDLRLCLEALRVVGSETAGLGELADLQEAANDAVEALHVWPVSDVDDIFRLAKSGISGLRPRSANYKSWWDRAEPDVKLAVEDAGTVSIPVAEVELVDDDDDDGDDSKRTDDATNRRYIETEDDSS